MLDKLKKLEFRHLMSRENILLTGIAIIGMYMAWNTVNVVLKNNQLQAEIEGLREEVAVLELENQNLALGIEYYKTDQFLTQSARENLLLKEPGELVAVAPKTRNAKFVVKEEKATTKNAEEDKNNFQRWIDFVSGEEN